MQHEKYDGQDDGEYHFSDDQLNYDAEPEVVNASPAASGGTAIANASQYKKPIIGLVVFFALIFLVYKVLAPSSANTPATEITAAAPSKPIAAKTPAAPAESTAETVATPAPEAIAPAATPDMSASAAALTQPSQPPAATPATVTPDNTTMSSATTPAPAVIIQDTAAPPMASSAGVDTARLASLEDKHAKMQTEYTQKLANLETQSSAVQGKLQDLNMRLASIEATLNTLTQNLQELKGNRSASGMAPPPTGMAPFNAAPMPAMPPKPAAPKMIYVVQAIIPGRAWLKSEAGDTVTVAEGDVLKDFGRVMKIDPYDGIVEVDIGGKLVSLSYGSGGE